MRDADSPPARLPYRSPRSGQILRLEAGHLCSDSGEKFPVVDGIPRFVSSEGYAKAFGVEWKSYPRVQLDSSTGTPISRSRLERCLGFDIGLLKGRRILEAGCGTGRFTEHLVNSEADVYALDLSVAVEVNKENIGSKGNYHAAQASLLELPFAPESFDVVMCLGVLQHTPSTEASIDALWRMVKPSGLFVIDHYTWSLSLVTKLAPLYRLALLRFSPERARVIIEHLVDFFFPLHWAVRSFWPLQALLSRISPCLVYFRAFPQLTKQQQYEFCKLDTFDHLMDRYKHIRSVAQIRRKLKALSAEAISVWKGGNGVEARATKANSPSA